MTAAGKTLTRNVTLPIIAIGAVAGKAAIDFDKSMRNVNSIAQLNERQFDKLSNSVLNLAGPTAQAPKTLADGLYDLVSSGFDSGDALRVLDKSARAATAGLTTTEVSTAAVAATLNAYHLPASRAGKVSDQLFRTVDRGVITFEELAGSIGDVLPFAASLGVGLDQVGASTATMTKAGINAPETMTRIKNVMVSLLKPQEDLSKAIKQTGFDSGEALVKNKGFQGGLEALVGTTDGTKQAVAELFPNIRALGGVLALTGKNASGAQKDLAGMKDASGATARALSQQSKSLSFQWNQFKADITAVAIKAAPDFLDAARDIVGELGTMVKWFDKLSPSTKKLIINVGLLGAALGPVLVIGGKLVSTYGALLKLAGKLGPALGGMRAGAAVAGTSGGASSAVAAGGIATRGPRWLGTDAAPVASSTRGVISRELTAQGGVFGPRSRIGALAARGFASSFAAGLAPALAVVGIGNIVSSAVGGDMRSAGFEVAGSLAGGVAGALLGKSPAAAMIGASLGSFAGTLGNKLFGAIFDSGEKLSPMRKALADSALSFAAAAKAEQQASRSLTSSSTAVEAAHRRQRRASKQVDRAERQLTETRKHFKAGSLPVVQAELAVARAKRQSAKASREAEKAERLHGIQLKLAKPVFRSAILDERHRINVLQQQKKQLLAQGQQMSKYGASIRDINQWNARLERTERGLARARAAQSKTLSDAASQVGPKFAKSLERASGAQLRAVEVVRKSGVSTQRFYRALQTGVIDFGDKAAGATNRVKSSYEKLRGVQGPFLSESRTDLRRTAGAYRSAASASGGALSSLGGRTESFLKAIGAKPVNFDFKARGGAVQRPMAIVGEEAPQHPEWVIATNPAYRRDNVGYWMQAGHDLGVPGFARGGNLRKPQILGPEHLRTVGQAPVDRAHRAALAYIKAHRPKGGTGSVAGYVGPPPSFKQLGDNAWVDSHTMTVARWLSSKFGVPITDGWRPQNASYGAANSSHKRGTPGNPGAVDFGTSYPLLNFAKKHIAGLTEAMIHDSGLGLHTHLAFFRKGGKIDWGKLVGSSWDNDELATLAHIVGMKNPGLMAQIAQGESSGNAKAVGHDPGGTQGLGLWQITTGYNDDLIKKYGGRDAMFNPLLNAKAAKEILDRQGTGAWYAPPTGARGRVDRDLAEKMRAAISGKGTDPDQIPVHGRSKLSYDEKVSKLDRRIARAETTAKLRDDRRAATAKLDLLRGRKRYLTREIAKINRQLRGKLRPPERERLLDQRASMLSELSGIPGDASSLIESLREAGVGPKRLKRLAKGLGIGTADLNAERPTARDRADLQLARAEMTAGKADDLAALQRLVDVSKQELKVAQKKGNPKDIADATRALKEATDNLAAATPTAQDFANRDLALAELTETLDDDRAALQRLQQLAEEQLAAALQTSDPRDDIEAAQNLKSVNDSLRSLDETIQQQNEILRQREEFERERLALDRKLLALAERQGPAFLAAFAAWIDDAIGGPTQRRLRLPTTPGVAAGYQ